MLPRLTASGSLLALGLWAAALRAQSPAPQQPVFRAGVDLVQIDVVALDKDGHPVTGLTAADFTLFDRKKEQKIVSFDEVTRPVTSEAVAAAAMPPAAPIKLDVSTNQIPATDRLVVMVLDDLHVFKGRTDRVKDIARQVLDALRPGSSISILFTSGRQSIEFTRDRGELVGAIDTFVGQQAARRPNVGSEVMPGAPRMAMNDSVANGRMAPQGFQPSAPPSFGGSADVGTALPKFFDDMTLHRTMEDAARMLIGANASRKAFVLIAEGTGNNLDQMFKTKLTPCEITRPANPCYHQRTLLLAVEAMQRANVSLYVFDARGYVPDENVLLECTPTAGVRQDPCVGISTAAPHNWIRNSQHGFEITAAATGGFAVTNSDDFSAGVARMVSEIDHYYLLGFTPSDPKGGGFRPVDVKVNRPGITLHFRQGYTVTSADDAADKKRDADPVIALSESVLPKTDLSLRLMSEPVALATGSGAPKNGTTIAAILEVTLPRAEVRQADGSIAGDVRYTVLAGSLTNGRVAAQITNTATIAATSGLGSATDTVTIEIPEKLTLAPGRYQLRASALMSATARGGSVYLDIDVPDVHDAPLVLGGPFVGSDAVAGPAMATRALGIAWPFTPSLDRRFNAGSSLQVFCPVIRHSGWLDATLEIRDAGGRVARSVDLPRSPEAISTVNGLVPLSGLTPGGYTLRVHVTDGAHSADRQIGFVIQE